MEQPINKNSTNQTNPNNSINIDLCTKNRGLGFGLGIASFVLGILATISFFLTIILSCVFHFHKINHQITLGNYDSAIFVAGVFCFASLFTGMISFVLGFISFFQKNSNRAFAIIGFILSSACLILIVLMVTIGIYFQHGLGM